MALLFRRDLKALSTVSRSTKMCCDQIADDENALLWQSEFCARDPILYGCFIRSRDSRTSWLNRLLRLTHINRDVASHQCLDSVTRSSDVFVDVVLYNHPIHGFLVNVGELHRSVVIYGIRRPPSARSVDQTSTEHHEQELSSAEAYLAPFKLPMFAAGAPAPLNPPARDLLVLHSINSTPVSTYTSFDDLIGSIKSADEMCLWRLIFYSQVDLNCLPIECCLQAPLSQ